MSDMTQIGLVLFCDESPKVAKASRHIYLQLTRDVREVGHLLFLHLCEYCFKNILSGWVITTAHNDCLSC